jgi:hypothetical protein
MAQLRATIASPNTPVKRGRFRLLSSKLQCIACLLQSAASGETCSYGERSSHPSRPIRDGAEWSRLGGLLANQPSAQC